MPCDPLLRCPLIDKVARFPPDTSRSRQPSPSTPRPEGYGHCPGRTPVSEYLSTTQETSVVVTVADLLTSCVVNSSPSVEPFTLPDPCMGSPTRSPRRRLDLSPTPPAIPRPQNSTPLPGTPTPTLRARRAHCPGEGFGRPSVVLGPRHIYSLCTPPTYTESSFPLGHPQDVGPQDRPLVGEPDVCLSCVDKSTPRQVTPVRGLLGGV